MTHRFRWLIFSLTLILSACAGGTADVSVPTLETGVDPEAWVTVPAGPFLQGQHEHETFLEHDYAIMLTDVTNAQYADFLNAALAAGEVQITADAVVGYYPGGPKFPV